MIFHDWRLVLIIVSKEKDVQTTDCAWTFPAHGHHIGFRGTFLLPCGTSSGWNQSRNFCPKPTGPPYLSKFNNLFYSFSASGKGPNPKRIGEGSDLNESHGTAHERPEAPNWTKISSRVVVEDSALRSILHLSKCKWRCGLRAAHVRQSFSSSKAPLFANFSTNFLVKKIAMKNCVLSWLLWGEGQSKRKLAFFLSFVFLQTL